jgi:hypothetical protein
MSTLHDYEDGAQWRAIMRDPSFVRGECQVIAGLLKELPRKVGSTMGSRGLGLQLL